MKKNIFFATVIQTSGGSSSRHGQQRGQRETGHGKDFQSFRLNNTRKFQISKMVFRQNYSYFNGRFFVVICAGRGKVGRHQERYQNRGGRLCLLTHNIMSKVTTVRVFSFFFYYCSRSCWAAATTGQRKGEVVPVEDFESWKSFAFWPFFLWPLLFGHSSTAFAFWSFFLWIAVDSIICFLIQSKKRGYTPFHGS